MKDKIINTLNTKLISTRNANFIAIIALVVSFFGGYSGLNDILSPRVKLVASPRSILYMEATNKNTQERKSIALLSFALSNIGKKPFSQSKPPAKVKLYLNNHVYDLGVNRVTPDILEKDNKDLMMIYNGLGAMDFSIQNPTIDPGTSKDLFLVIESFELSLNELKSNDSIEVNVEDTYGKSHSIKFNKKDFKTLILDDH